MAEVVAAGVRTYYAEHGDGPAVVLLHGGMTGGDSWSPQISALAERFRVLVPDRRGHGRTPDVDGPYTYGAMAEETIAFIEQMASGPAHLVGWSDGANVAMHVARDRPDLVGAVVAIGGNFHHDGLHPGFDEMMSDDPDAPEMAMMRAPYEATSPDGAGHWPVFMAKVLEMWANGPTMTVADLSRITSPVLVMVGDDDCITYEHTVTLFESLPHGQLAVIPGTSHLVPMEKPALVNALILDFLADTSTRRWLPMRFTTV